MCLVLGSPMTVMTSENLILMNVYCQVEMIAEVVIKDVIQQKHIVCFEQLFSSTRYI